MTALGTRINPRELTTLSGSALGSLLGGLLASPLGPWAAVGGATMGTTVGGYLATQVWQKFYLDLGEKLADARRLLEEERTEEAAETLIRLREHPRFAEQEENFRSELEHTAARVLGSLAARAESAGDLRSALEHCRQARLFQSRDPELLWSVIRLGSAVGGPYEDSDQLREDLELLLALDGRHVGAARSLAEMHERLGRPTEAARVLRAAASEAMDRPRTREELLRWAIRLAPGDGDLLSEYATLLLETARAREAFDLLEGKEDSFEEPDAWRLLRGRALHGVGSWAAAREILEPLASASDDAALLAGMAASNMGDDASAARMLEGLTGSPTVGREAVLALVAVLIRTGELDVARNHLEREGLSELPGYEPLLKRLAKAYENRGLEDRAARIYDLMRDLGDSTSFWARFTLQYRDGTPVVLGSGSAGRVLLGKRRIDELPVAIREAPSPFALGGKAAKRFAREVETLSALVHPNLVALLGHALPESKCLLAMEYCSGGSLASRVGRPPLWPEVKRVMGCVAEALAFLARQDPPIVHRNLKPSNVLFTADGEVKVSDFSMARPAAGASTSVVTSIKERAAVYLYQSPEVILGSADVGLQADVYSFGCILHELVIGTPPFQYADVNRQISAHFRETPAPPSEKARWVPRELDEIVMRCLEKDPVKRYSDAGEVWASLKTI